jgi:acetyl esterase
LTNPVLDEKTSWFLKFLRENGRRDIAEISADEARANDARLQSMFYPSKLSAELSDVTIPVGPNGNLRLRIIRPPDHHEALPVVMFFHGGGWILGDAETYDRFMREIAVGSGSAVVFVEYSRAPEARYPVPLEECYAATRWIAEHGSEQNMAAAHIAVLGDSAGGNMAAAVTLLAKQRGGPKISGQALIYPKTSATFDTPSFEKFADGYFINSRTSRWFWRQYAPDAAHDKEPTACPLEASVDQLKGLPPALVVIAECDVLRDEGEEYARKLLEAGVPVTCTRYLGVVHGFLCINALADTPAARSAMNQVTGMLREVLHR